MNKILLLCLFSFLGITTFAYNCEIENIYYTLNSNDNTASVEHGEMDYTGEVIIPSSFTYEGVTYSVTSIGSRAFYNCSDLISVTIPESVTSIGNYAFSGCTTLNKVIVKDLASWCKIQFADFSSNPLSYAHHLYSDENTEITQLTIPDGVTSISDYAFYWCNRLTSVTIPQSVISIGNYAFSTCSELTSVTIPESVTSIGNYAFYVCSGLTSVAISESVTSIGESAFQECSGLTYVTIPKSVTSIGKAAFSNCI